MTCKCLVPILGSLPLIALWLLPVSAKEPKMRDEFLERVIAQADIRTSESGAFRLRAKYRSLSPPKFEATYLLIWTPQGHWREQVLAAGLDEVRIGTPDGNVWHSPDVDGRAAEVFSAMRILDSESDAWPQRGMLLEQAPGREQEGLRMNCMRARKDKARVLCVHSMSGALLWESFSGSITRQYTDYTLWASKNFPRKYRSYAAGALVAEIEVEELARQDDLLPALFEKRGGMKASKWCRRTQPPRELRTALPPTPSIAVTSGSESLTIEATIGTDGRLSNPVFHSSSALVGSYGRAIAEEWRFEPATCDGQPIESVIKINASISCRHPSTRPHLDCESHASWEYKLQQ